jgi:hypothetical protein
MPRVQERPSIPTPIDPRGFFSGVKIRPIALGAVVDYVATQLIVVLYVVAYYLKESPGAGGFSQEAIDKALREMISSDQGLTALLIIGSLCTALGGFVAGWLARGDEVKHGAIVGAVSLLIGVAQSSMAGASSVFPSSYEIVAYLVAIPAGALGGYWAQGMMRPVSFGQDDRDRR